MHSTIKGSIALSMVIKECFDREYQVYLPFDQHSRCDLIVDRHDKLERVQVKYVESDNIIIDVRCRSVNSSQVKKYTPNEIDLIAIYDKTTNQCYFVPSNLLGENGRRSIYLRLVPVKTKQVNNIIWACDYKAF